MNDAQRIQIEYARRAADPRNRKLYDCFGPAGLRSLQEIEEGLVRLLRRERLKNPEELRLLDVGCGGGLHLARWISWGVSAETCCGIDLLTERIAQARSRLPAAVNLREGDASQIPFDTASFDLVTQFTVFSSILDDAVRVAIAREMVRVLRPGGLIVWYDFWLNPVNPRTRGIRKPEIRRLFPNCRIAFEKITLAPPLMRRLAPFSLLLCGALQSLRFLNTHFLASIRPISDAAHS